MADSTTGPSRTLRVGIVQMASGGDVLENVEAARAGIEAAAQRGADLVALPEVFNDRGVPDRERSLRHAATTLEAMRDTAATCRVAVLAGSVLEPSDGKLRNVSHLIDARGGLVAAYTKVHLFRIAMDGLAQDETRYLDPGTEIVTADLDGVRVGLTICFDVRFPELYRELAQAGARIVFVPANFSATTGPAHWSTLLRARAIENQVFIVAPAQSGTGADGFAAYGHSMMIDPWGTVLAEGGEGPAVLVADLDLGRIDEVRPQVPVWTSRRPEVYGTATRHAGGSGVAPR